MPIGLGIGCSHSPAMYTPKERLKEGVSRTISNNLEKGNIVPSALSQMTQQDLEVNWERYRRDHDAVRQQIEAYHPDVMIMLGGDHGNDYGLMGSSQKVNMLIYTGTEAAGRMPGANGPGGMIGTGKPVHYKCDSELAKYLANELITKAGFDMAVSEELRIVDIRPGSPPPPPGSVLSTSFINISEIMPSYELPTVLIYLNTFDPLAMVSAKRCYELGQAIARLLEHDPRRIAILGSGGLSHDPFGPRMMWADEPLDKWILEQFKAGNGRALNDLYTFDSMTTRGGTGETRCWITVAGAMEHMGAKAKVIDYIYGPETVTGNAFAYWRCES